MPRWTGLMPNSVATGNTNGTMSTRAEKMSSIAPSTSRNTSNSRIKVNLLDTHWLIRASSF